MLGSSSQYRILVVDDDKDIVQTIRGNLELDRYQVFAAYDGYSCLQMAREHRLDLIIFDLNLPDIDGIKACQILRREYDFSIIMLTARDSVSDKVLGLEYGAAYSWVFSALSSLRDQASSSENQVSAHLGCYNFYIIVA